MRGICCARPRQAFASDAPPLRAGRPTPRRLCYSGLLDSRGRLLYIKTVGFPLDTSIHELDDGGADWHASRTKQGAASAQEPCRARNRSLTVLSALGRLLRVIDA